MGFGHRVYKSYDPRAKIIKRMADLVFEVTGKNPLLEMALELERIALEDEYFVSRKLYPNVDFYSGLIYQAMGFPVDMFPVLFAIPRTAGWIAQWEEMLTDPEQKIARPRQIYLGSAPARLRAEGQAAIGRHADERRSCSILALTSAALPVGGAGPGRRRSTASARSSDLRQHRRDRPAPGRLARRCTRTRDYITQAARRAGLTVEEQAFDAQTRRSAPSAWSTCARRSRPEPASGRRLVIAGHYDTKLFKDFTFVGANDGGSSTAFLIELARALQGRETAAARSSCCSSTARKRSSTGTRAPTTPTAAATTSSSGSRRHG